MKISESVFASLFADSCWIKFSKLLLYELSTDEAVVLSYLINVRQTHPKMVRKNDGWFTGRMKYLMSDLWMGKRRHYRILAQLKKKGFIQTEMRRVPAKRWVKINFERIRKTTNAAIESIEQMNFSGDKSVTAILTQSVTARSSRPYTTYRDSKNKAKNTPRTFRRRVNYSPKALFYCDLLKETIKEHPHLLRRLNVQNWKDASQAKHFDHIIKSIGKEHFDKVFRWFLSHLHETDKFKLPNRSLSPRLIRSAWLWIDEVHSKEAQKEEAQKVHISEDAKELADYLLRRQWPKGSEKQLPQVVQLSLDNLNDFNTRLQKYVDRKFKHSRKSGYSLRGKISSSKQIYVPELALHIYRKMDSSQTIIKNHFLDLNTKVQSWDKWKGDLFKYVIKPEDIIREAETIAQNYGTSSSNFQKLMEKINAG